MLKNLFLIYFFFNGLLKAQNIDHFEIYELNNQAFLTLTISQGSTCDGIIILRSTDSINYTQVGKIPGVCGSSTESKTYHYTDENSEYNTTLYYKIQLGNFLLPNVVKIKIFKAVKGNVHVFPNPCIESIYFVLDKMQVNTTIINVFDLQGKKVMNIESQEKAIELNTGSLNSGIYYYQIMNEQMYTGQFIVN